MPGPILLAICFCCSDPHAHAHARIHSLTHTPTQRLPSTPPLHIHSCTLPNKHARCFTHTHTLPHNILVTLIKFSSLRLHLRRPCRSFGVPAHPTSSFRHCSSWLTCLLSSHHPLRASSATPFSSHTFSSRPHFNLYCKHHYSDLTATSYLYLEYHFLRNPYPAH